jgi:hypothetical protein
MSIFHKFVQREEREILSSFFYAVSIITLVPKTKTAYEKKTIDKYSYRHRCKSPWQNARKSRKIKGPYTTTKSDSSQGCRVSLPYEN